MPIHSSGHHSRCVRIPSVTSYNTGHTVIPSLDRSYLLLILSLAILHFCTKVMLKRSNRKPHRHDAYYTNRSNSALILGGSQDYIGLMLNILWLGWMPALII